MKKVLLLAIFASAFCGVRASADFCPKTSGYGAWTSATAAIWSCTTGTPSAGDDFEISGTAEVVISTVLVFNTGTTNVVCKDGGLLRVAPGAGFDFTGSTGGTVQIQPGCKFVGSGIVVTEGHVATAPTYAAGPPSTAAFTIRGGSPTNSVVASDMLYFPRNQEGAVGAIRRLLQTWADYLSPGYYRLPAEAGRWYALNARTASTITYLTNAYANPETLPGAGADPFGGTRGPGLTTPTTGLTTRTPGGLITLLSADLPTTLDGDFGGQYVVWHDDTCDLKRAKILMVDANTSPTLDTIYLAGDATGCNNQLFTIEYGLTVGDPYKIIRPAVMNGGNVATFQVFDQSVVNAQWMRFKNLGFFNRSASDGYCNICFWKQAATGGPSGPSGYMRFIDIAYPNVAGNGAATGALGMFNTKGGLTSYMFGPGETLTFKDMEFSDFYIHDQRLNSVGAGCPGSCEGVHGTLAEGVADVTEDRFFVERIGDDGIAWFGRSFGAGDEQPLTVRQMTVYDLFTTVGSNSQQCIDLSCGANTTTDILHCDVKIEDFIGVNCKDGIVSNLAMDGRHKRLVLGGTTGAPGQVSGFLTGYTLLPDAAIETNPDIWTNMLLFQLDTTAASNGLTLNGYPEHSVIAGNLIGTANGGQPKDWTGMKNSYLDLGNDTNFGEFFDRSGTSPIVGVSEFPIENSILRISSAASKSLFSPDYASPPKTHFNIENTFFSVDTVGSGAGFLQNDTGDDDVTVTMDNVFLAMNTPVAAGMRGLGVTQNGATVQHACVETTLANQLTNAANYGSARTPTSFEYPYLKPDPSDDVPITLYTGPNGVPNCGRPELVGLTEWGEADARLGDIAAESIKYYTTIPSLLDLISGTGGGSVGGGSTTLPPQLGPLGD